MGACAFPARAGDTLVQVSTIDALVQGIYEGPVRISELLKHGDFGLGTLDQLDGEMLALDGRVFQITSDGKVHSVPEEAKTPFAAVTFFKHDHAHAPATAESLESLEKLIDGKIESLNLFYAVRVEGRFSSVKLRSVPRQAKPYRRLTQVVKEQTVFDREEIEGTLVGFRCPPYVKGLNVTGYHFHFLSKDRTVGGHVLDCALEEGRIEWDVLENLRMIVPDDSAFLRADFSTHDAKAVEAVETVPMAD
jgi:acetolactate decarboxylase